VDMLSPIGALHKTVIPAPIMAILLLVVQRPYGVICGVPHPIRMSGEMGISAISMFGSGST
jgi:propanediol utilization protein